MDKLKKELIETNGGCNNIILLLRYLKSWNNIVSQQKYRDCNIKSIRNQVLKEAFWLNNHDLQIIDLLDRSGSFDPDLILSSERMIMDELEKFVEDPPLEIEMETKQEEEQGDPCLIGLMPDGEMLIIDLKEKEVI